MKKQNINELTVVSKFIEKFFDGLEKNTAHRIIAQARKARVEAEAIQKMEEIVKNKKDLEAILAKYPLKNK